MYSSLSVVYPLEKVLEVKHKRVNDAAAIVTEKQRFLNLENEKLKQAQEQKERVKTLRDSKLEQLRKILDKETSTDEIQQSKAFLDSVNTKLRIEEEKVRKQEKTVHLAEIALEEAKRIWKEKRKEVEKIEKHKEGWMANALKELAREEAKKSDELGTIIFLTAKSNPNRIQ